jgi:hypothetical protein
MDAAVPTKLVSAIEFEVMVEPISEFVDNVLPIED